MKRVPIPHFGPVNSLTDSTEIGISLTNARNIRLRPDKGFSGCLIYERLFGIGNSATVQAIYRALPFTGYPSGVGVDSAARTANKTVAIQVKCQGENFLLFYDLTATTQAARGFFYLGQDNSAGDSLDLTSGTVTYTVLAVGLNAAARWYGTRTFSEWKLGNGVDDNVCVQLNRTTTPGIWRKAASNARPATPTIALVTPAAAGSTQASWEIPTWGGPTGKTLTFTANDDNYPGINGNDRIRVSITPSMGALTSALLGTGAPTSDPFQYSITGGQSLAGTTVVGPVPEAVATFVNTDSKILAILSAAASSTGTSLPDSTARGPTTLSGGTGTGGSAGFSDRTATVILRYWDPGQEGLGYEGISSEPSNTLIIPADSNKDIRVTIPVNPSAEGGRFPFIRVYLNFGEGAAEIFNLMNPDSPVPNTANNVTGFVTANAADTGSYPETFFCYSSRFSVTASTSTDAFTAAAAPANDTPVMMTSTALMPGGITAFRIYYVINRTATTFQLSLTLGGAAVNLTSVGTGTRYVHALTPHGVLADNPLTFSAGGGGVLPSPISSASTYYARNVSTYTFQVATTPGGAALALTTTGTQPYSFTATVSASTRTVQLGLNSVIGQVMSNDQNRPLPHTHHAIANSQVWRAGVTGFQERVYVSKPATVDELAPEGAFTEDYAVIQSSKSAAGSDRITALYSDDRYLHIHCKTGIILLNPRDLTDRDEPQVDTGAINGASMCVLPNRSIYYIGANIDLMSFDASLNFGEIVGTASISAASAISYIRALVDTDAIAANPDRSHLFLDKANQMLWYFLPGLDGTMTGFAYDLRLQGIVGPFDWPKIYATTQLQPTRPEIVFADEDANLFFFDPTLQVQGDSFGAQGAFTPVPAADAIPVADAGYGSIVVGSSRYLRAYRSELETAYWDLGDPENRKAFLAFFWRTLAGSRALFTITFTTLSGDTQTFDYGDVAAAGDGVNHRALLMASDTAIKAEITILSAQQKKWAVRDCGFNITPQQAGSI